MQQATKNIDRWAHLVSLLRTELIERKGGWRTLSDKAPFSYRFLVAFAAERSGDRVDPRLLSELADRMGLEISFRVSQRPEKRPRRLTQRAVAASATRA